MTRTTPFRFTILHLSHILRTLDRTFTTASLFGAERDAPPREIVGREFHFHFIARQNSDEIHPHLSRNMCENFVAILKFYPECRIGKGLEDRPFYFNGFFFRCHAVKISGSPSPMETVCSK